MDSKELKDKIKVLLDERNITWVDIAHTRHEKNANNLHNKFNKGTIRFDEVQEILNIVECELTIAKKF